MSKKNELRKLRHKFERLQHAAWIAERDTAVERAYRAYRDRVEAWHAAFGERVEWEEEP
jgi:hypothetical protein